MNYAPLLLLVLPISCATTSAGTPGGLRRAILRDTATAPEGTARVEAGVEVDPGDRTAVPLRIEYGYSDEATFFLDVDAYQKLHQAGPDGEGFGDLGLGWRQSFFDNEVGTTGAFEGRLTLPTGDKSEGTGTGSIDLYAAGILTQSFEEVLFSSWLELGVLGDAFDSGTDMQRTVGLAAAANLSEKMIGFGVLERTFGDHIDPAFGRFGVAWRMGALGSFDAGLSLGLNDDAPDGGAVFIGFSSNLGPLGPRGSVPAPAESTGP